MASDKNHKQMKSWIYTVVICNKLFVFFYLLILSTNTSLVLRLWCNFPSAKGASRKTWVRKLHWSMQCWQYSQHTAAQNSAHISWDIVHNPLIQTFYYWNQQFNYIQRSGMVFMCPRKCESLKTLIYQFICIKTCARVPLKMHWHVLPKILLTIDQSRPV